MPLVPENSVPKEDLRQFTKFWDVQKDLPEDVIKVGEPWLPADTIAALQQLHPEATNPDDNLPGIRQTAQLHWRRDSQTGQVFNVSENGIDVEDS